MESVLGRDPISELTDPAMRARVLSESGRLRGLIKSPAKTLAARQNAKKPRLRGRGTQSAKKLAAITKNLAKARQAQKKKRGTK